MVEVEEEAAEVALSVVEEEEEVATDHPWQGAVAAEMMPALALPISVSVFLREQPPR